MVDVDIVLKRDRFDLRIKEMFSLGITGIYGPSGSGKTSLLKAIAGLERPNEGRINFGGKPVFCTERKINLSVAERHIGYVFQEGRLFPHMTVENNLRYGYDPTAGGLSFYEVVELLQLSHILKRKPAKISGGERQRTALGRSLLSSPDLLLLDEPFSALDLHLRNQILPFLYKINQTVNIPILVVSHDIGDLLKLSDKLFIIREGRCLGHGPYTSLLRSSEVRELLGTNVLLNTMEMMVTKVDYDAGMVILADASSQFQVNAVYNKKRHQLMTGHRIKLFVRADDIALSGHFVDGISIQNQLKGQIKEIVNGSNVNLCIVDIGITIVVEVTAEAIKQLHLQVGSAVWCLFKSVSIDFVA